MKWLGLAAALCAPPTLAWADAPSVTAQKPWMRYLLPSIPAAGYMVLQNNGAADAVLTAASSPSCGMLMLHQSQDESGMAMMMDVGTITIPAHGSISFAPGGYHLMCMAPNMKPGGTVTMVLTFQGGAKLDVSAPVYGAQGAP
jgi:copper(I)-binding protein